MKYQKIGVFDSGIGGLTVLRDLKQQLPEVDMAGHDRIVCIGDSDEREPHLTVGHSQ